MIADELKSFPVVAALLEAAPEALTGGKFDRDELTLEIAAQRIVEVCAHLKDEWKFARLSTVTAVDWYPEEPRFEVVYHLHSPERNERLRLKCRLPGENPVIDSVTVVWRSANWYERETFDLFGIRFCNHPDLRRIMLPEDWEGHPLRKDHPVTGDRV
ncbi:MAG TPA: NADH-quinone oxidoreductase subunit C [Bryobacteraceae bacterium]|nr:NADH-quinone oxidoreductase subunit C [Bryobacteraceae bacterium]